MAHFSESLCEEVIRTGGKCGLSHNEMTQMARFALQAIRQQNPLRLDAIRYRWLKDEHAFTEAGVFIARQDANGVVRWMGEAADQMLNEAMSGGNRSDAASGTRPETQSQETK
jgi:hypothetical protein